jgi:hypothetical protein
VLQACRQMPTRPRSSISAWAAPEHEAHPCKMQLLPPIISAQWWWQPPGTVLPTS